jgi:hypothetical protein
MKTYTKDDIVYNDDDESDAPLKLNKVLENLKIETNFRNFESLKEYNQDFLAIFKTHRTDFVLDYSQKDGHFRV